MSDEYDGECERKVPTSMEVRDFDGGRPGTAQAGMTRRGGIVALGVPNARAAEQATFRGREALRRVKSR